ncbi:PLP-dependent transferase [Atractiella rhizophila]|nr:PLP-dependent transferase [Atractiella rhizophila]
MSPASGYIPSDTVNLGQGFMNWLPPSFLRSALEDAIKQVDTNHYSHPRGRLRLRNALSEYLSPTLSSSLGRKLDPASEIVVTAGADEGIHAFFTAFLNKGDEVILFEPFFDQYIANVKYNGGTPIFVPLHPPPRCSSMTIPASEWKIDMDEFRAAITGRTKAIILNNPHNPVGKIFSEEELREIGKVAEEFNLLILSDEVYDCLALNGEKFTRIAAVDDLWKRTVTVGSGGKTFAATGWRIGWCFGPEYLIQPLLSGATRIVFCCNSPCQEAMAVGLEIGMKNGFFDRQRAEYAERLQVVKEGLDELGLPYTIPQGGYFVLVCTDKLNIPDSFEADPIVKGFAADYRTSFFITQTAGVVSIPVSAFHSEAHWGIGEHFVRLSFGKDLQTLREGMEKLRKLKVYLK